MDPSSSSSRRHRRGADGDAEDIEEGEYVPGEPSSSSDTDGDFHRYSLQSRPRAGETGPPQPSRTLEEIYAKGKEVMPPSPSPSSVGETDDTISDAFGRCNLPFLVPARTNRDNSAERSSPPSVQNVPATSVANSSNNIAKPAARKKKMQLMQEQGHKCDICGRVFARGVQLGGHKRAHYGKKIEYKKRKKQCVEPPPQLVDPPAPLAAPATAVCMADLTRSMDMQTGQPSHSSRPPQVVAPPAPLASSAAVCMVDPTGNQTEQPSDSSPQPAVTILRLFGTNIMPGAPAVQEGNGIMPQAEAPEEGSGATEDLPSTRRQSLNIYHAYGFCLRKVQITQDN